MKPRAAITIALATGAGLLLLGVGILAPAPRPADAAAAMPPTTATAAPALAEPAGRGGDDGGAGLLEHVSQQLAGFLWTDGLPREDAGVRTAGFLWTDGRATGGERRDGAFRHAAAARAA